jgi:hypothetical protein
MTNITTAEGLLSCVLVFICSCTLVRRVKVMQPVLSSLVKQFGPLSIVHKASILGQRLVSINMQHHINNNSSLVTG